jgi:hypothetical protein
MKLNTNVALDSKRLNPRLIVSPYGRPGGQKTAIDMELKPGSWGDSGIVALGYIVPANFWGLGARDVTPEAVAECLGAETEPQNGQTLTRSFFHEGKFAI